ncbi:hypothetical protein BH10BAC4_BH10BAC4_24220 [soil metagenome]
MSTIKDPTELSGVFGESVSFRKIRGRVVAKNRPKRKMPPASEDQIAIQKKFVKASKYAKAQMLDAERSALYETGITLKKKNAFLVAISDALNAPEVNEIRTTEYKGAVGNIIKIDAVDDFKVARVIATITDNNGNELEQGEAVNDAKNPSVWRYTALVGNPGVKGSTISVTAFDHADNETTLEKVL